MFSAVAKGLIYSMYQHLHVLMIIDMLLNTVTHGSAQHGGTCADEPAR